METSSLLVATPYPDETHTDHDKGNAHATNNGPKGWVIQIGITHVVVGVYFCKNGAATPKLKHDETKQQVTSPAVMLVMMIVVIIRSSCFAVMTKRYHYICKKRRNAPHDRPRP